MAKPKAGRRSGWSSSTRSGGEYAPFNEARIAQRVEGAVAAAREIVPRYARGKPCTAADVELLLRACHMRVLRADIAVPADVWPPVRGIVNVFIANHVGPTELRYIKLHEIGHRLAGDLEEPTIFVFDGPLPESEEIADLFALLGILDAAELDQGPEYVEARIRELVPLDNYGWQTYRVPRLAGKVCGLRGAGGSG